MPGPSLPFRPHLSYKSIDAKVHQNFDVIYIRILMHVIIEQVEFKSDELGVFLL